MPQFSSSASPELEADNSPCLTRSPSSLVDVLKTSERFAQRLEHIPDPLVDGGSLYDRVADKLERGIHIDTGMSGLLVTEMGLEQICETAEARGIDTSRCSCGRSTDKEPHSIKLSLNYRGGMAAWCVFSDILLRMPLQLRQDIGRLLKYAIYPFYYLALAPRSLGCPYQLFEKNNAVIFIACSNSLYLCMCVWADMGSWQHRFVGG